MPANTPPTAPAWRDPDDAPDLARPPWRETFAAAAVRRGRPKLAGAKVSTTLRLDPEILAHYRATGPRWQSRINAALKAAIKGA